MSSTDTGLGNFATLPPELRLCIWDWLFPRHIIGPLKGPPIFKRRRTRLPILRTSKELYAEISHHLYSRISVAIRLNPRKHQWLAFRIQNLGISWLIEEKEDAIQRGFDKFPLQRVPIYIGIHPPNPASPGDLIRLWQNVQSLVNILEHAPSIKSMHVQFLSNMRYRWHEGEQGLKNVTYSSWYNRQFYDHQIIYLQFCRLEKVQSMKVSYPTELDGVLRWTMEDGAGVHLLKQDCENDYHCISGGPHFRISSKFDSLEDFFNKSRSSVLDGAQREQEIAGYTVCVHIKSYCSPILFSRLPISMTTPSAVSYQALAGEIIRRELALKVTVCLSAGRSNLVYQVDLSEPTREAYHGSRKPGTVAMPENTGRLMIRFFKPFDTYNEGVRVENKVAAMTVARLALADSALHTIIPQVYGWNSGKNEPSGQAWVLEEYVPGKNLGDDFPTLPSDKQQVLLAQLAEVVKAFQDYNFPETAQGFGGLAFNADGNVCAGPPSFQVVGSPFSSHAELYRGLLDWQLGASDQYELINGWWISGLRDRLDRFVAEGLDGVLSKFPTGSSNFRSSESRSLIWKYKELLKTLYDPEILHITALLDYGLSHISIPAAEYLHYFHSISGALAAPYSEETEDLREAILHGFPDVENLPNSKPMRQGWAEFGSGRDIQWGLAKAWNDELVRVGALRPSTIDGADDFSRAHWFIQDLAPWHLFDPAVLEIRTPEQLEEARKEVEATLGKYLDGWGF
ncbi:hypothetical protein P875_00117532 [Aspergillus parasiticus SU-1]|uniref:Aminoglycoside phosphotransferase domain-containing protein n=1 Tax=Aspergillus parasiticus (strain ATCC 56775 / NRRL 5862 / SRRC 143 / SU-1) TaxID=1403190 RepID=A0A0F0IH36_ASPPU|nr:hypothetical protein P875_00117532 [Aspergillus parasiticus SU-1]